jgi:hypothetical protein
MISFLLLEQEQQEDGLKIFDFHTKILRKIGILITIKENMLLNIKKTSFLETEEVIQKDILFSIKVVLGNDCQTFLLMIN